MRSNVGETVRQFRVGRELVTGGRGSALGVSGCLLVLALAGCQKEEAPSREAPHVSTPRTSEVRVVDHAPPPAAVAPLRRTATAFMDMGMPAWARETLPDPFAALSVSAMTGPGGGLRLWAAVAWRQEKDNEIVAAEFRKLGFKPYPAQGGDGRFWERAVASGEHAAFGKDVLVRLEDVTRRMDRIEALALQARQPGWLVWRGEAEPRKVLPGRLVYTGHPMDVALADAGADPHLFFVAEGRDPLTGGPLRVYLRGGPLFVADDSTLGLGNCKPAGEWKKVSADAEQVIVHPDGAVVALTRGGPTLELGKLQVVRLAAFKPSPLPGAVEGAVAPEPVVLQGSESLLRVGHLEFANADGLYSPQEFLPLLVSWRTLKEAARALAQAVTPTATPAGGQSTLQGPLVVHADLAWTDQHLKALGVPVERTPGRTTIALGNDPQKAVDALTKVLEVLRQRMAIHDQNLRNAERIRDAENRLNPYRRKILKLGPQGEAVEEADQSPFPKVYKAGDPNADADGYVTMPNVNRALETAEFQAAAEEYRLVRACMERLAPQQIFPDPLPLPPKPEGR